MKAAALAAMLITVFVWTVPAQNAAPREDRLLNGLRLLVWNEPAAEKVTLKVRIHAGSAFDPAGKEGLATLLTEILFPGESVREFFTEDLGGSFSITAEYDYIQIDASSKPDQFLLMMETIANALSNPQFTKENTARVKAARLERLAALEKDPAFVADLAAGRKLFSGYPYGRPQTGTSASIAKIDFADFMEMEQRFMTSDNATLIVAGNVKPDYVLRVAKRLFGGWVKADKKVPHTFAQPDAPSSELTVVESPAPGAAEFRVAMRGFARNDKDYFAGQLIERVWKSRIASNGGKGFVRHQASVLPGMILVGASAFDPSALAREGAKLLPPKPGDFPLSILKAPVRPEEFEAAKRELQTDLGKRNPFDLWLDVETYKLASVKAEQEIAQKVALADVQRAQERLLKEPSAMVLVHSAPVTSEK